VDEAAGGTSRAPTALTPLQRFVPLQRPGGQARQIVAIVANQIRRLVPPKVGDGVCRWKASDQSHFD
jgi:hypothetical protein